MALRKPKFEGHSKTFEINAFLDTSDDNRGARSRFGSTQNRFRQPPTAGGGAVVQKQPRPNRGFCKWPRAGRWTVGGCRNRTRAGLYCQAIKSKDPQESPKARHRPVWPTDHESRPEPPYEMQSSPGSLAAAGQYAHYAGGDGSKGIGGRLWHGNGHFTHAHTIKQCKTAGT